MKTLIIEDEKSAVRNLRNLIALNAPHLEIIAELEGIEDTIDWFKCHPMPDLIFMDIHLSDGSSFEIFDHITVTCPIIFTTAYDAYALKAFKVNSIDYLLKPIQARDIMRALEKLRLVSDAGKKTVGMNEHTIENLLKALGKPASYRTHFLIPSKGDKLTPLDVSSIFYFYIAEGTVYAVTEKQEKIVIPHTLDEIQAGLDPRQFYRINRQYIINRKAIKDIVVWFTGRLAINPVISTEEKMIVSRQKVTDFKTWFMGSTDL